MDINVEPQPKSTVKVTVTITPAEMSEYFEQAARQLAPQVNVPGFRRGKVPRSVLAKQIGPGYLAHQALEVAVTDSYYQAVKKHNLQPIASPTTDIPHDDASLEKDGLTYTAVVPVMPEVDLGDYQNVKITPTASDFKADIVKETLEQLRRSRAENKAVDRPAAKGDRVEIDYVGTLKGNEFEGGKSENHPLVLGEDNFIPGFADQILGMHQGAVKKFKIKFPKDYHEPTLANQKVEFTVTLRTVEEVVLPDLTDEFAKQFGADSMKDLQKRLEENLRQEKENEARRATEMQVMDAVLDTATVEVPEILIEEELEKMVGEFRQGVEQQGLPYDKYLEHIGKSEDDIKAESSDEAAKRAKLSLVLNKIQATEKITASPKEVQAEIDAQLKVSPDQETTDRIQGEEFRRYVTRIVGNRTTLQKLVKRATA